MVCYSYVHCIGQNYHKVELLDEDYSAIQEFESSVGIDVLKQAKAHITAKQNEKLELLIKVCNRPSLPVFINKRGCIV
jgi:hypothetical protein